MFRSRRICGILFIILFFLRSLVHAQEAGSETSLTVGIYHNPPLIYMNLDGKASGLFIELLEHIAEHEKWHLDYKQGSWNEVLLMLENNKLDILPAIAFSESRAHKHIYTEATVFSNWAQVYSFPGVDINSFLDLEGKRIAVLTNDIHYSGDNGIKNILERFTIQSTFIEYPSYIDVLQAVERNTADAGIVNRLVGRELSRQYEVETSPLVFNPIEMKFASPKQNTNAHNIIQALDKYIDLERSDEDSFLYQLFEKYITGPERLRGIPDWLKYSIIILAASLLMAFGIIVLFRQRLLRSTKSLRQSRQQYKNLFDSIRDTIIVADLERHIIDSNQPALRDMFGYEKEEVMRNETSVLYADQSGFLTTGKLMFNHNEKPFGKLLEINFRKKDGSVFPGELFALKLLNEKGEVTGNIGVIRDITARKEAEDNVKKELREKEVLLQEIHHRVKNNLNVVISLLKLQRDKITTVEKARKALEDSSNRIYSMALVHESLYLSRDLSSIKMQDYIEHLINQLRFSNEITTSIEYQMNVHDIVLNINTAIPCGIILTELITNAAKHAFTEKPHGTVLIELKKREDDKLELVVADNGIGLSKNFSVEHGETLGLQLVRILTEQIDGILRIGRGNGTSFSIVFPPVPLLDC